MLSILSTLVPVFGIILFGIVVERMGFLPIETSGCLNQFVYWIGLPMMLFNQLARMEAGQMSGAMVGGILLGYGITYLFAYVVFSSLLRRRWEESSVFALLSSFPNAAFMGLPIVVLLLPDSSEAAIVASLCAVMTSANLLFTDGRLEAGKHKGEGRKQVFLSLLRSLFHNPLLIYSALGAAAPYRRPEADPVDVGHARLHVRPLRAVLHGHDPLQADDFLAGLRKGMG